MFPFFTFKALDEKLTNLNSSVTNHTTHTHIYINLEKNQMDLVFLLIMDLFINLIESWGHFAYFRSTYLYFKKAQCLGVTLWCISRIAALCPCIYLTRKTKLQESKATKLNKILCFSSLLFLTWILHQHCQSITTFCALPSRYHLQYIAAFACIWTTGLNQKCKNKHKLKFKIAAKVTVAGYRAVSSWNRSLWRCLKHSPEANSPFGISFFSWEVPGNCCFGFVVLFYI